MEEDAGDDPENIEAAEEELPEFKSNLNTPRKKAGARVLFPEAG